MYRIAVHWLHRVNKNLQLAMYRQYRQVNAQKTSAPASSNESVTGKNQSETSENLDDSDTAGVTTDDADVDAAVSDAVDNCWTVINQQCFEHVQQTSSDTCKGWKTIRVFVSSTFADMHSEREILIKKV